MYVKIPVLIATLSPAVIASDKNILYKVRELLTLISPDQRLHDSLIFARGTIIFLFQFFLLTQPGLSGSLPRSLATLELQVAIGELSGAMLQYKFLDRGGGI